MLREMIKSHIKSNIPDGEKVAVMFSGGLDSTSVLLSAIELGYNVRLYTFYRSNVTSKDLETSRIISRMLNIELVEVEISNDLELLVNDLKYLIKQHDLKKKTQFQVMHPMKHVCSMIEEDYVLSGLEADTLYGNTRSMRKLIHDDTKFKKTREKMILDEDNASYSFIKKELNLYGKTFIAPYKQSKEIIDYFLNMLPKDLCYGKQKKQTYEAFKKEIDTLNIYRRSSNMQINSTVRELHDCLLETKYNTNDYKSVTGVYNRIIDEVKKEVRNEN